MNHELTARRLTLRRRAVLVAHLFGSMSLKREARTKTRQQRWQSRRGYLPRSRMQQAADSLASMGLLAVNGGASRLTRDGRAVLAALLALYVAASGDSPS